MNLEAISIAVPTVATLVRANPQLNSTESYALDFKFYSALTSRRARYPADTKVQVSRTINASYAPVPVEFPDRVGTISYAEVWVDAGDYDDGAGTCTDGEVKMGSGFLGVPVCGDELFFIPRESSVPGTNGYATERDVGAISGAWDNDAGKLTLTGSEGPRVYTTALRSVYFHPSSYLGLEAVLKGPPNDQAAKRLSKTVWFRVYDESGEKSNLVHRNVSLSSAVRVFTDRTTGKIELVQ